MLNSGQTFLKGRTLWYFLLESKSIEEITSRNRLCGLGNSRLFRVHTGNKLVALLLLTGPSESNWYWGRGQSSAGGFLSDCI